MGVSDLAAFAAAVGAEGPVTIAGRSTRGGAVPGVRAVAAPIGIEWVQADEMTACCGAGTPVDDLSAALAEHGQGVALPAGGTVGGALAVGQSDVRRLGWGPVRDTLLQARYVSAAGAVVRAGGPTVKNVSGFDLCRLLVGSRGSLGFIGEVIVRTRPLPAMSQWHRLDGVDAAGISSLFASLYRPSSVLWDGATAWVLLEGHGDDVAEQAARNRLEPCAGSPPLPTGSRRSVPPSALAALSGTFVAEMGVGIVHHAEPWTHPGRDERAARVADDLKRRFDPSGRLNPGVMP
ncbi:MAG: FAD-binding oxidoreductase [Ilumatobacteraceae bacterium]